MALRVSTPYETAPRGRFPRALPNAPRPLANAPFRVLCAARRLRNVSRSLNPASRILPHAPCHMRYVFWDLCHATWRTPFVFRPPLSA